MLYKMEDGEVVEIGKKFIYGKTKYNPTRSGKKFAWDKLELKGKYIKIGKFYYD